jgi:glucosamine--fructose-6-phosphate aminotransferase (isomerizing)
MKNLSPLEGMKIIEAISEIPEKVQQFLKLNEQIREIAASIKDFTNALYLGRGINYPVALEGALQTKRNILYPRRGLSSSGDENTAPLL